MPVEARSTTSSSKSVIAEVQACIDDEVALLKLSICALLSRRNTLFAHFSSSTRAPAPLLHTLRLLVTKTGTESVLVPDTLFSTETPALQTLELYRCHISWSSPIFTGLTTLRLREIASSSQPTITELLAMLRHMPDLAHLCLENALSSAKDILTGRDSLLSECLDLPHLSRLALVAPFSTVVVFLSNVTVPLMTEIRLCCRRDAGFTASYTPLYPLLERRFNTAVDVGPVIRTLNIKTTSRDVGFVLSTSERDCDVPFYSEYGQRHLHEDWVRDIPLKLDIELDFPQDGELLMYDICRIIPMVHLHTLAHLASTDMRYPLSSLFLETTFGNLQELRFIKLIQLQVNDWTLALSRGSCNEEDGVENAENIFAPALEELQVTAVTFECSCHSRSTESSGSAWYLHKALAHRKAKGCALKKLVIAGSNCMSSAPAWELRKVVDEVDWDECTLTSDSTSSSDGDD
ncbi:hypothetical protein BU15DRAFT_81176 [Melanogaster broomeanus]|nr:hypothetical protein BU15DRAFT_81176 [Melanogaster broomeanus]